MLVANIMSNMVKIYHLCTKLAKSSIQITACSKSGKLNINLSGTNAHIYTPKQIHTLPTFALLQYG